MRTPGDGPSKNVAGWFYAPSMNRIDRLYALVEGLRAAGSRGRTARQLAQHFEVSVRDRRARPECLPPLNFTPREAAAVAVALSRSEHVMFARDARSALQKIMAAMPERALEEARSTAAKVRLIVEPVPDPDAEIAETIWRAVRGNHTLRIRYIDVRGLETEREVEPQHVVVGPNGSYLTAWCHLRNDDRVFRMDRITRAERTASPQHRERVAPEPVVDSHRRDLPAFVRPEDRLTNTDTGVSRPLETVDGSRRSGG
jgi:predicted DNA-binding transcriptional regulator YafY